MDTFKLAEEIQRWIGQQKCNGENILHAGVCCDYVGRIKFIKEIEKIIKPKIKQLEDEIAGWKLKYIAVCEKKDLMEEKNKALKAFIRSIKCQLDVMNAKL